MHLVRAGDAPPYDAPGHHGLAMRRLQGREAGPSESVWIGLSVIEPGGRIEASASPLEKFYVVLDGHPLLRTRAPGDAADTETRLAPHDSVRIAPGESRAIANPGDTACTVLLVMPNAPA